MDSSMEILTEGAQESQEFGQKFASSLKGGEVIGLVGELGSGKTTFVQGLARGLGIKNRIISPTFILRRDYTGKTPQYHTVRGRQDGRRKTLIHIDLYRLEEKVEKEFRNLGIEEDLKERVVVIEWAEKVRKLLPKKTIWITFENLGGEKRKINIKYYFQNIL